MTPEEIWSRLIAGKSLARLDLPTVDGYVDLRGFTGPKPASVPRGRVGRVDVDELVSPIVIRGAHWDGVDFSGAQIESLRFFDCTIRRCRFDDCRLGDWRLWGTSVSESSFVSADLRNSALGPVDRSGKRNSYSRVDFSRADLRKTVYVSADFTDCNFANARLNGVDFQGAVFVRSTFAGDLEDVLFYRHAFRGEAYPPNEMRAVDFRGARLHHVEFRRLDMTSVQWPTDDDHVAVGNYANVLDRLISTFGDRGDIPSKKLVAIFSSKRKWIGANQTTGLISLVDVRSAAGDSGVAEVLRLLQSN